MHRSTRIVALFLGLCIIVADGHADELKSYSAFAEQKRTIDGFFPELVDDKAGKVYLVIPSDRGEFIFQDSLPQGLGSNDVGLDRGQLGKTRIVKFERVGEKVLLRQ